MRILTALNPGALQGAGDLPSFCPCFRQHSEVTQTFSHAGVALLDQAMIGVESHWTQDARTTVDDTLTFHSLPSRPSLMLIQNPSQHPL